MDNKYEIGIDFTKTRLGQEMRKITEEYLVSVVNNKQSPSITIVLSENGGFVITPSVQKEVRQKVFTATTIDEAIIIVREQLEALKL